jgi:heat-inducible transcriptional repressor
MDKRKELILNTIIKEHVSTGAPVGSGAIAGKYKLDVSSATVRNEMAALEEEGYIAQPYTSAGRIPTEKAYKFLVHKGRVKKISRIEQINLEKTLDKNDEESLKKAAKEISNISGSAIFWAFHRHNLYYTGISNLFQQPEFSRLSVIHDISAIIDRIDEIINEIFSEIENGLSVKIGSESPFGNFSSTIIARYGHDDNHGLFGIIGPMRMDYEKNIALIDFVYQKLTV